MRISRTYVLRHVVFAATFAALMVVLPGCIILAGAPGSSGTHESSGTPGSGSGTSGGTPLTMCLRDPDVGGTSPRELSPDEQARADEVCQYLTDRYQEEGWDIVFTAQMPSGDFYDWIDAASVAGAQEEPPPPMSDMVLPPGFGLVQSELDLNPLLRGPDWTMPVVRPNFSLYISGNSGATSIEDFVDNYQVPGAPDGGNRLYAGISSVKKPNDPQTFTKNVGASAWVTAFTGPIEEGTMSLLEMAVGCRNLANGEMEQQIGIAAVRDHANFTSNNFSDAVLRLNVEFLTHGGGWTGPTMGGWDSPRIHDFHRYQDKSNPLAPVPGMTLPTTVDGLLSVSLFWIRLWNGNWWIGWNGFWVGHYDGTLFGDNDSFATNACEVLWYGEVYDPKATPTTWTKTDMGSGQFASDSFSAASFTNPSYLDMLANPQWPDHGSLVPHSDDHCYTTSALIFGLAPLYRYFYCSADGGAFGKYCTNDPSIPFSRNFPTPPVPDAGVFPAVASGPLPDDERRTFNSPCSRDSDCRSGFCDRGTCIDLYSKGNYGRECHPALPPLPDEPDLTPMPNFEGATPFENRCMGYLCIDRRCRSCESDAECQDRPNASKCLVYGEWPGKRCGNARDALRISGYPYARPDGDGGGLFDLPPPPAHPQPIHSAQRQGVIILHHPGDGGVHLNQYQPLLSP